MKSKPRDQKPHAAEQKKLTVEERSAAVIVLCKQWDRELGHKPPTQAEIDAACNEPATI